MNQKIPDDPPNPKNTHIFKGPHLPINEFRHGQWDIIKELYEAFQSFDVMFLQAPTGIGKTIIGETTGKLLNMPRLYVCTTKQLQDQFSGDFRYASVVKGRANYTPSDHTLDDLGEPLSCADCNAAQVDDDVVCDWCSEYHKCPYVLAVREAEQNPLAVLNTSYWLTDSNKGKARFATRNLNIIDEADGLENELLNQVEVNISSTQQKRMRINPPKIKTEKAKKNDWQDWVSNEAIPKVNAYLNQFPLQPTTRSEIRNKKSTLNLRDLLRMLEKELPQGNWIYDGYNDGKIIFRPIRVNNFGGQIWDQGNRNQKFLLMSSTILSDDLMANELGLDFQLHPYDMIDVPSPFPVENRPIYYIPVANMTSKLQATERPKMVEGIASVLSAHPNDRVLIHTVSYNLSNYLLGQLKYRANNSRPFVTYNDSKQKNGALNTFKSYPNSVLLAPSMDRGIDLPGDDCRVQIVAKISWPNLGDKRISARANQGASGGAWYAMQAIRSTIQMSGRIIRGPEDFGTTYILDEQFQSNLWVRYSELFPKWWKDALRWDMTIRKLENNGKP